MGNRGVHPQDQAFCLCLRVWARMDGRKTEERKSQHKRLRGTAGSYRRAECVVRGNDPRQYITMTELLSEIRENARSDVGHFTM